MLRAVGEIGGNPKAIAPIDQEVDGQRGRARAVVLIHLVEEFRFQLAVEGVDADIDNFAFT